MDLGASLCAPRRPACALCPWAASCRARAAGTQETFPRKAPKREGRLRRGAAFVAVRADGRVLLRKRPDRGLLSGMTEVPGSEWTHDFDAAAALNEAPPVQGATWRRLPGVVRHVFTHFPLELVVYVAHVPRATAARRPARWVRTTELGGEALPSVMRKVLAHALGSDRV
jgi:A/G-specific adenine glycosylase